MSGGKMSEKNDKFVYEVKKPVNFHKSMVIVPVILILLIILLRSLLVVVDSGEIGVPVLFGKV